MGDASSSFVFRRNLCDAGQMHVGRARTPVCSEAHKTSLLFEKKGGALGGWFQPYFVTDALHTSYLGAEGLPSLGYDNKPLSCFSAKFVAYPICFEECTLRARETPRRVPCTVPTYLRYVCPTLCRTLWHTLWCIVWCIWVLTRHTVTLRRTPLSALSVRHLGGMP